MDIIMKLAEEQPMALVAGGVTILVVVVSVLSFFQNNASGVEKKSRELELDGPSNKSSKGGKSKGKGKKKKGGAAASKAKPTNGAAEPEPSPVPEPPAPQPQQQQPQKPKTKQQKKKAAAEKKKEAAKEVPPPVPEPVVEAPAPAPEPAPAAGKKKKKKKKKGGADGAKSSAEETAPVAVDSDEEEDDILRLLSKKQLTKVAGKATVATTATTVLENGSQTKTSSSQQRGLAMNTTTTTAVTSKDDWVSVSKGFAALPTGVTESASGEDGATDDTTIHSITLDLSLEDPPVLIGPQGATIQAIQESSSARLDISKSSTAASVKISGTQSAIANAMEQVQTLVSQAAEERRRATAHTITLSGDKIKGSEGIKAIIGKGGATIQDIQAKTGANLKANVESGTVVITGPSEEQVQQAATLCRHAVFGESQHIIELKTRGMVLVVYGKDFAKIREMQNESGAKLDIEKGTTTLKLSGPIEAVAKARKMVEDWMEYCKGKTVQIEAGKVGAVYGKAGQNIRSMQDRTGAFIEVDDQGKKGKELVDCKIMGTPEAVEEAMKLFQKAVDGEIELKAGEVLETLECGRVGAPAVIGKGGSKIRELEKKFAVKLNVNSDTGICNIVGKKPSVEKAKAAIEEIVKPLLEEQRLQEEASLLAKESVGAWNMSLNDNSIDGW